MDRNRFLELLQKYLQDRATPKEKEIIDTWYANMESDSADQLKDGEDEVLEDQYWSAINRKIKTRAGRSRMEISWRSVKIAASFVLAVAASFSIWSGSEHLVLDRTPGLVEAPEVIWKRIFNGGEGPREVTLPDGSVVTIEPQSELRFLSEFDENERRVWLEGEAFFNVCPDKERPFLVEARQLMTKVVGTSFRVKAYKDDKEVTVAVKTGKVSVTTEAEAERDDTSEIILTPNQKIVYDKVQHKVARMIVEKPEIILPEEEVRKMRFEAAPVSEIFNAIEKVYGVELEYDVEKFSECKLTSVISDGQLYKRLDIICKAIGAHYELRENHIVISGGACTLDE